MQRIWICGLPDQASNYVLALKRTGLAPIASTRLSAPEGLTEENFAGLVLPGGGDMDPAFYGQENRGCRNINRELDLAQLQALDTFVKLKKPVLGICKGHQTINIYFGGTLIQNLWNADYHQAQKGKDSHHPVQILPDTPFSDIWGTGEIMVNSAHHQAVDRVAEGLRVCAYSDDGVIEGFCHRKLPILGLQWHPERMAYSGYNTEGLSDGSPIFQYFREML